MELMTRLYGQRPLPIPNRNFSCCHHFHWKISTFSSIINKGLSFEGAMKRGNCNNITPEEFVYAAKHFIELSDTCFDSWTIHQNDNEILNTYIKKEEFVSHRDENEKVFLYRAEYIIFYNLSYGVPTFSFNIWDSSGKLLTLEEVRQISLMKIGKDDFYSVVTQQDHPVMYRPYFIIHPCHTAKIISAFKYTTKNLIITFLGLITPLIRLNLPLEYGL